MSEHASIIQGSPEWFAARLGKVTASRVADIIAKINMGASASASRRNYMAQLVAERLTGQVAKGYSSPAMEWGSEVEAEARAAYEFYADADVQQVGFVPHLLIAEAGASPDGLVGQFGLVEIKCPNTATHIDNLINQKIPARYVTQMQWQMACTQRDWCDFVSFDPRMPESMKLFVQRVERDGPLIWELEQAVIAFLAETGEKVETLRSLYERKAAA